MFKKSQDTQKEYVPAEMGNPEENPHTTDTIYDD